MPVLDGISAAERIAAERIAPVVILTAFSQRELVERARDAGAMAYLVKPFTKADLVPAIEMAVSRYSEIKALDEEVITLKDRLEVRKLLDRAKGLLQSEHGLTEPQAFRWIQKTSMDRRLTMRKVAEAVIEGTLSTTTGPTRPTRPRQPNRSLRSNLAPAKHPNHRTPRPKAAVGDPGTRWYRVRLPRADTFSTGPRIRCRYVSDHRVPTAKRSSARGPLVVPRRFRCVYPSRSQFAAVRPGCAEGRSIAAANRAIPHRWPAAWRLTARLAAERGRSAD